MSKTTRDKEADTLSATAFFDQYRLSLADAAMMAGVPFREMRVAIDNGRGPHIELFRGRRWIALSDLSHWCRATGRELFEEVLS